eukprot:Hpha_TRINITY_DN16134_c1_g4::TRINITY_DN16134_c1_g4_i1::g.7054::m.7054
MFRKAVNADAGGRSAVAGSSAYRSSSRTAAAERSSSAYRSSSIQSGPDLPGEENGRDSPKEVVSAAWNERIPWLAVCVVSVLLALVLVAPILPKSPPHALEAQILTAARLPVAALARVRASVLDAESRLKQSTGEMVVAVQQYRSVAVKGAQQRLLSAEELEAVSAVAKVEADALKAESELMGLRQQTELEELRLLNALGELKEVRSIRGADVALANCLTKASKACPILVLVVNEGPILDEPGLRAARNTYCRTFRCAYALPEVPPDELKLTDDGGQVLLGGGEVKLNASACKRGFKADFEKRGSGWQQMVRNQFRVMGALRDLTTSEWAKDADWVMLVTTHSFLFPSNTARFLAQYDARDSLWLGDNSATAPRGIPRGFICGAGGGVISKGAIQAMKLAENIVKYKYRCMKWEWMLADIVKPLVRRGDMRVFGHGCGCSPVCPSLDPSKVRFVQDTDAALRSRHALTPVAARYSPAFPVSKAVKLFKRCTRSGETPLTSALLE